MTGASDFLAALAVHPALILVLGSLVSVIAPAPARRPLLLAVLAIAAAQLVRLPLGEYGAASVFGADIVLLRLDPLARTFAVAFLVALALNLVYGWSEKDRLSCFATLAYPGAALGGVLAGDLLTLFVWWEIAAVASAFLIFGPGTRASFLAGLRYLGAQILSGALLLAGAALVFSETGALSFGSIGLHDDGGALSLSGLLLLLAFGLKAGFPLLHAWAPDAYPRASFVGTVVLSVFTTKLAVYALARGFAGTEALVIVGAVMTVFPVFFALIENDLRRVLSYSIVNQVGFMVAAIGAGEINGAAGYAFSNMIFESLLFMAVGAALYRTGTSKATELGGLYRTMPVTMTFCLIGALSIAAAPLFAGFVTKGLILDAVAEEGRLIVWLALLFASAGVLEHASLKIPYFTFFAHDSGKRPKEAPPAMLLAMGTAAALCILIGVLPAPFYAWLPEPGALSGYEVYAPAHVVSQLQLLVWAVLAFALLIRFKWYPAEVAATNLDADWLWRVPGRALASWSINATAALFAAAGGFAARHGKDVAARIYAVHGPEGGLARSWPAGSMALWTAVVLAVALIIAYWK